MGQDRGVDANAVVSYNVRAIRRRRGLTQQAVAERLGRLTGRAVAQAAISAMECTAGGDRRHRFDAQELYLLSVLFEVPIVYFFLPPPDGALDGELADTGQPPCALYPAYLGRLAQLEALDERLLELEVDLHAGPGHVLDLVFDARGGRTWAQDYRSWRDQGVAQLRAEYGDRLVAAAALLGELARRVRALSPGAHLDACGSAGPPAGPEAG